MHTFPAQRRLLIFSDLSGVEGSVLRRLDLLDSTKKTVSGLPNGVITPRIGGKSKSDYGTTTACSHTHHGGHQGGVGINKAVTHAQKTANTTLRVADGGELHQWHQFFYAGVRALLLSAEKNDQEVGGVFCSGRRFMKEYFRFERTTTRAKQQS